MASFSNEVKREILTRITDKDKRYTLLYGMLICCKSVTDGKISFITESEEMPKVFASLVKSVFSENLTVSHEKGGKRNNSDIYSVSIKNKKDVERIFDKYGIDPLDTNIRLYNIGNNSLNAFLAGAFLMSGSVSDPLREYHLEFSLSSQKLAAQLQQMLRDMDINAKLTAKKGMTILYVKESESIEDLLTFIGASGSTIELINIKIFKDMRNKANRIKNCDTANIDRAVAAATRQLEDIKLIKETGSYDTLSNDLKEVCELRLNNHEMTLKEIGELLSKPIGRSGVARRFGKIAEIAEKLRKGNNIP